MDRCDNVLCTSFCYTCSPVTLPASWPSFRSLKTQFLSWAAQFNWTIFSFVKTSFTRPGLGHRKWVRRRNWRQNCSHPLVRCDQEHRWKPTENHHSVITSRLPCKRQSEKVPEIRIFLAHLLDPVLELCVVWCTGPGCDRQHRLEKFVKFFLWRKPEKLSLLLRFPPQLMSRGTRVSRAWLRCKFFFEVVLWGRNNFEGQILALLHMVLSFKASSKNGKYW